MDATSLAAVLTHAPWAHALLGVLGFQIGPKIRIGGTLGKLGQDLKIGLGKAEKAVAPIVSLIPGVGTLAAPILNTSGNILDTSGGGIKNIGQVGKIALGDALLALPGATGLSGKLASAGGDVVSGLEQGLGVPGAGGAPISVTSILKQVPAVAGIGGGGSGAGLPFVGTGSAAAPTNPLIAIGRWLGGNGGRNALGLAEGVNTALKENQANQYAKDALNQTKAAYDSLAPLRSAALSSLLSAQGANPFARGG